MWWWFSDKQSCGRFLGTALDAWLPIAAEPTKCGQRVTPVPENSTALAVRVRHRPPSAKRTLVIRKDDGLTAAGFSSDLDSSVVHPFCAVF